MTEIAIYVGLFWNAFLAATLLPALSEIALAALLKSGNGLPVFLFLAATVGNVSGSVLNWWLGMGISRFQDKHWFPFSLTQIKRASDQFGKYGKWSLLLAWVPIIGDPLTLISGVLRTKFPIFLLLVTIGKSARYGLILWIFYH